MDKLREKIMGVPDRPGVYLMKDAAGNVLYIGKAKSLKKRLSSYFGRDLATKTLALMSNVSDIEFKICATESLALLLEASLIRKHKPKYNVSFRDDKSFPLVKLTSEDFPLVYITRKKEGDGARYLGPYTNAKLLREALKIIRRAFPFRSCKNLPKKSCIYYRLKLCPAPCIGGINKKEYAAIIGNCALFLEGKTDYLISKLSRKMQAASVHLKFEEAAQLRDQIAALSAISLGSPVLSAKEELEDLQRLLNLPKLPERIEAFDISNIKGKQATGSMVSFFRGRADKNNYRRFRIKTVKAVDDYKMLSEVIYRRYSRLIKEGLNFPDLILIDGGKSHLMVAEGVLKELKIRIPLLSIAKEQENIYIKNKQNPIRLGLDTPALNLIRRIRDEAHRFAISYHHLLRRKKMIGK